MKLVVSAAAAADIARLHAFLADKNAAAAERAVTALIDAVKLLETLPERGRPSGASGIRELVVPFGQSNYVLRYAHLAQTDELVVLRVWHGREERE